MARDSRFAATAVLLRAAARLARVPAAVLIVDGETQARDIHGLSEEAAADVVAAVRGGRSLSDGLRVAHAVPVVIADHGARHARLLLLDERPLEPAAGLDRSLAVLAAEIGHELRVAEIEERRDLRPHSGARLEALAGEIDASSDPAAVLEAPRVGNVPRFMYVNAAFERFFGFTSLDVMGQPTSVLHGSLTDLDRVNFLRDRARAGNAGRAELVCYGRDGIPAWVEATFRPTIEANGAISQYVVHWHDVTARKEFEAAMASEKRKLNVTLAAIGDGVIGTVSDGRVESLNPSALALLGIEPVEAYGEPLSAVLALTGEDGPVDAIEHARAAGGVAHGEARLGARHIGYSVSAIGERPEGYVVVLRDITAQKVLANQLSYEASHDKLTGLFNRRKFEEELDAALTDAREAAAHHTLAFCDLDHFKIINDECGHAVGDRVLRDIGQVLAHSLRERDLLARLGGDEFAVLLRNCSLENARKVLEKLRRAVSSYANEHAGRSYRVGVSIGLAPIDASTTDSSAVLAVADAACYAAKAAGRNVIVG